MSLDKCIPITRISDEGCVSGPDPTCNTGQVPIGICNPPPDNPPGGKCVNDNIRRPWPTPPPAEIGCNPVSLQVTNSAPAEDDPDQTIRLEGDVSYISGDACLPQVQLNLVVPPTIAAGGGTPSLSGFGYTTYQNCVRVGPGSQNRYRTPQDFYGNEPGAAAFYPKPLGQMGNSPCEDPCIARSRYGAQVAKFNLIGPLLAEIQSSEPAMYHYIEGTEVVTAWKYRWIPSVCVLAADLCLPACEPTTWASYDTGLQYDEAWNNKENVFDGVMVPGVDLAKMLKKGYKPQPIMAGTQVLMYGWIPWGTKPTTTNQSGADEETCGCEMVWFFSEQVAFDGDCDQGDTVPQAASMLPTRTINSAGMFFGSPNNANRV